MPDGSGGSAPGTGQYAVGTLCWVKHEGEVWAPAEIVEKKIENKMAKLKF